MPDRDELWLAAFLGSVAVLGLMLSGASSISLAIGEVLGASVVIALLPAAYAQLILSGVTQLRRCPHFAERIQAAATVCKH